MAIFADVIADIAARKKKPKRNKYNAVKTRIDGITFDSKKEARYYGELKLRVMAGEVSHFLMQVPLILPGGVRYRLDFLEFWMDGSVHYIDAKGVQTAVFKIKKKQVEALYPITIEVV